MCKPWDVLETGRLNVELSALPHLNTLQGRWEQGADFLSPVSWTCLIYSPAGRESSWQQLHSRCGNPAEWLTLRWRCPLWSGWSRRQIGKGPSFLFLLPLTCLPPSLCLPGLDTSCAGFMPREGPSGSVPWQAPAETRVAAAQLLPHNLQGRTVPALLELQQGPAGT